MTSGNLIFASIHKQIDDDRQTDRQIEFKIALLLMVMTHIEKNLK